MAKDATINSAKGRPYEITGWPKALLDYRRSREYAFLQLFEIAEGLRHSVDVITYANPSLDHHQMYTYFLCVNFYRIGSCSLRFVNK